MGPGALHPFITEEDSKARRVEVTCTGVGLNSHSSLHFTADFPGVGGKGRVDLCGVLSCGGGPAIWDLAIQAGIDRVRLCRGVTNFTCEKM